MTKPALGARLRKLREKHGVNLRDLSEATGVDFSLIGKYENGQRNLSEETFERLSKGIEQVKRQRAERSKAIADELRPIMELVEVSPELVALKKKEIPVVLGMLQMARAQGWKPAPLPSTHLAKALIEPEPVYKAILETLAKERKKEADMTHVSQLQDSIENEKRRRAALKSAERGVRRDIAAVKNAKPGETVKLTTTVTTVSERKRQLAELETLQGKGIDDPIVVELIESFRREIAQKEKEIESLNKVLEEK